VLGGEGRPVVKAIAFELNDLLNRAVIARQNVVYTFETKLIPDWDAYRHTFNVKGWSAETYMARVAYVTMVEHEEEPRHRYTLNFFTKTNDLLLFQQNWKTLIAREVIDEKCFADSKVAIVFLTRKCLGPSEKIGNE